MDTFYVQSDPPGAEVRLSTGATCVTPCGMSVSRRDEFTATVQKAGYKPKVFEIKTRLNATGVGDLGENLMSAGTGAVVDVVTGAALEHVPDPLIVALQPAAAASGERPRSQ